MNFLSTRRKGLNRFKVAVFLLFVAGAVVSLAGQALGYPPFLIKARKFGAKDCTFCHVDPDGGPPFAARGQWLIEEKERRKADPVDDERLGNYKAGDAAAAKPDVKGEAKAEAGPVEKELLRMFEELVEASKRRDAAVFSRILADDFSETNADGMVINKAQVLSFLPDLKIDSYEFDEVNTRVFGPTAITTLRQKSKGSYKGHDVGGEYRETLVWVKRDDRWQIAAAHISRVAR
jgi:hypothetical protein